MARPPDDFLNSLPIDQEVDLPEDQRCSVSTTKTCSKLFRPTVIWRFDTREFVIPVTEKVQFGWRWIIGVLFSLSLIAIGEVLGWLSVISLTSNTALSVLGSGILLLLYAVVARYYCLERDLLSVSTQEHRLAGGAVLGGCCLFIILGMTNIFSVLATLGLGAILLISIRQQTGIPFPEVISLTESFLSNTPRVPTRHSVYTILAAVGLVVYLSLIANISLPVPRVITTIGGFVFLIVVGLLWYIPTRRRARLHAFSAAVLSGIYVIFIAIKFVQKSYVNSPSLNQSAAVPLIGIASGLILIWASLWWIGIVNPRQVRQEFSAEGRQVSTHVAAIFAYLSIMGSGVLSLTIVITLAALRNLTTVKVSPWFGLVTVAFTLPALYFITGSIYQLVNVLRLSHRIRRHATPIPPGQLSIESVHPIKSIPSKCLYKQQSDGDEDGVFFAAAYTDLFERAILLTEYTLDQLSERELEAIVSHEESHFKYQGAQLQFLFATLPAFTLMGKNVVYSIYNFFQRELTADQHAYIQLVTQEEISPEKSLQSALEKFKSEEVPFAEENSVGFLPTMLSVPERKAVSSRVEQWFELFYGNFAGNVHPDTDTRRRALYLSKDLPLEVEGSAESRAGLILQELEEEENE